jgi:hypothetical protein
VREHKQELLAISISQQKCSCQYFQKQDEGWIAKPIQPWLLDVVAILTNPP